MNPLVLLVIADVAKPIAARPIVEIGVIVTALLGLLNLGYNLRHQRRASYVGAVTAARLKWIEEVRSNLARFLTLAEHYALLRQNNNPKSLEVLQELTLLRNLMRLQLIPTSAERDGDLAHRIESLFQDVQVQPSHQNQSALEGLLIASQGLLWEEWIKVKRETLRGDPYDTWKFRYEEWCRRMDAKLNS